MKQNYNHLIADTPYQNHKEIITIAIHLIKRHFQINENTVFNLLKYKIEKY